MMMNGVLLRSFDDLLRNFNIDELVHGYFTGELEIFLRKIGEAEKAEQITGLSSNAMLVVGLYHTLGLDPELTEVEIRTSYT